MAAGDGAPGGRSLMSVTKSSRAAISGGTTSYADGSTRPNIRTAQPS
jgi:hypothetical protein